MSLDFVFVANPWEDGIRNPTSKHHIALELIKQGHRVLWVNATGMRVPSVFCPADWRRALGKIRKQRSEVSDQPTTPRLRRPWRSEIDSRLPVVIAPLVFPIPGSGIARRINASIYMSAIEKEITGLGFDNPVLVSFLPIVPELIKKWKGRSVYYCLDRWDAFERYDSRVMTDLDKMSCESADMVVASSRELFDRCSSYSDKVKLITHGVTYSHFKQVLEIRGPAYAEATADKQRSEIRGQKSEVRDQQKTTNQQINKSTNAPILGFIGLISEWVDQDLLVKLARDIPDCRIVLIGKADVSVEKLERESNIDLIGERPFADLPQYVSNFDLGLIPFVVNDLTKSVNPIKLREMMAAGCPVVSTDLPEVERRVAPQLSVNSDQLLGMPPVVVARDYDGFVELVRKRLEKPLTTDERRQLSESVLGETWEAKTREFVDFIKM